MEQDASEDTVFASRLHGFVFERILLEGMLSISISQYTYSILVRT
jgi:hypothetical protein